MLGIGRMNSVPNALIRELCRLKKDLDEKIDEGVLRWFGHVERVERDRIAKRVYVGECASSLSVGRKWKRWIDYVKECLKKRCLYIRQARRMDQNRSEWQGLEKGKCIGLARGMNPST